MGFAHLTIPTVKDRREILQQGAEILAPALVPHGFHFSIVASGSSSGGAFAQGEFVRGDRKLELHFRWSLGLVVYRIGAQKLVHEDFMRALLGRSGASHYPGFSEDAHAAFDALRQDLVEHCSDFVNGTGEQFNQCVQRQKKYEALSGFKKMEADTA
jgi:hypothetical protein